jgi:hypothetical protein
MWPHFFSLAGADGVGRDLPARQVDRLEAGPDLLDRHVPGERAERRDVRLGVEELPEPLRPEGRDRVVDLERPAEALDVRLRVRPHDPVEAPRVEEGVGGSELAKLGERG